MAPNSKHEEGNFKKGKKSEKQLPCICMHAWACTFFIIMIPTTFCKGEHTHNVSFLIDSVKTRSIPSYLFSVIYSTAFDVFNPPEVVCGKDNKQCWVCHTKDVPQTSFHDLFVALNDYQRAFIQYSSTIITGTLRDFCFLLLSSVSNRKSLTRPSEEVFGVCCSSLSGSENFLCLHTPVVLIFAVIS